MDIFVDIITHKSTGLLVATSKNLPGFMAHGRTYQDLQKAIPKAIKDIMEATNGQPVEVFKVDDDESVDAFTPNIMKFATDRAKAA
jgi:hypothetical protein